MLGPVFDNYETGAGYTWVSLDEKYEIYWFQRRYRNAYKAKSVMMWVGNPTYEPTKPIVIAENVDSFEEGLALALEYINKNVKNKRT